MNKRVTELAVLMDGKIIGELHRVGQRVVLRYLPEYLQDPTATPLSVSMPVDPASLNYAEEYSGKTVANFIGGLLPDNNDVRTRWALAFACPNQPFDLLARVGEDCAGAAQFVRPERLDHLEPGAIEWLTEDEIADTIRQLRTDPSAWLPDTELGYFSLAGAQSKFALAYDPAGNRWGRASGAQPTTHIVKPASSRYPSYETNEHLTLRLASALGLITAGSEVLAFADTTAIVVTRYDRLTIDGRTRRIHQEDLCQALGIPPARKYEAQGGPTATRIAELLRDVTVPVGQDTVERFADALAFNWLTAGTDAHAKNYSLLLSGSQVRLAPLYDLGSALPYVRDTPIKDPGSLDPAKLRLAMRVDREYTVRKVRRDDWDKLANTLGLERGFVDRVELMAQQIPVLLDDIVEGFDGPNDDFVDRYRTKISHHALACLSVLRGRVPKAWD